MLQGYHKAFLPHLSSASSSSVLQSLPSMLSSANSQMLVSSIQLKIGKILEGLEQKHTENAVFIRQSKELLQIQDNESEEDDDLSMITSNKIALLQQELDSKTKELDALRNHLADSKTRCSDLLKQNEQLLSENVRLNESALSMRRVNEDQLKITEDLSMQNDVLQNDNLHLAQEQMKLKEQLQQREKETKKQNEKVHQRIQMMSQHSNGMLSNSLNNNFMKPFGITSNSSLTNNNNQNHSNSNSNNNSNAYGLEQRQQQQHSLQSSEQRFSDQLFSNQLGISSSLANKKLSESTATSISAATATTTTAGLQCSIQSFSQHDEQLPTQNKWNELKLSAQSSQNQLITASQKQSKKPSEYSQTLVESIPGFSSASSSQSAEQQQSIDKQKIKENCNIHRQQGQYSQRCQSHDSLTHQPYLQDQQEMITANQRQKNIQAKKVQQSFIPTVQQQQQQQPGYSVTFDQRIDELAAARSSRDGSNFMKDHRHSNEMHIDRNKETNSNLISHLHSNYTNPPSKDSQQHTKVKNPSLIEKQLQSQQHQQTTVHLNLSSLLTANSKQSFHSAASNPSAVVTSQLFSLKEHKKQQQQQQTNLLGSNSYRSQHAQQLQRQVDTHRQQQQSQVGQDNNSKSNVLIINRTNESNKIGTQRNAVHSQSINNQSNNTKPTQVFLALHQPGNNNTNNSNSNNTDSNNSNNIGSSSSFDQIISSRTENPISSQRKRDTYVTTNEKNCKTNNDGSSNSSNNISGQSLQSERQQQQYTKTSQSLYSQQILTQFNDQQMISQLHSNQLNSGISSGYAENNIATERTTKPPMQQRKETAQLITKQKVQAVAAVKKQPQQQQQQQTSSRNNSAHLEPHNRSSNNNSSSEDTASYQQPSPFYVIDREPSLTQILHPPQQQQQQQKQQQQQQQQLESYKIPIASSIDPQQAGQQRSNSQFQAQQQLKSHGYLNMPERAMEQSSKNQLQNSNNTNSNSNSSAYQVPNNVTTHTSELSKHGLRSASSNNNNNNNSTLTIMNKAISQFTERFLKHKNNHSSFHYTEDNNNNSNTNSSSSNSNLIKLSNKQFQHKQSQQFLQQQLKNQQMLQKQRDSNRGGSLTHRGKEALEEEQVQKQGAQSARCAVDRKSAHLINPSSYLGDGLGFACAVDMQNNRSVKMMQPKARANMKSRSARSLLSSSSWHSMHPQE